MKNKVKNNTQGHRTCKDRLASKFLGRNVRVLKGTSGKQKTVCSGEVSEVGDGYIVIDGQRVEVIDKVLDKGEES